MIALPGWKVDLTGSFPSPQRSFHRHPPEDSATNFVLTDFFILMGVAGSGKSTVGARVAELLGWRFIESDDRHSEDNRNKMRSGIALNDDDRTAWLQTLVQDVRTQLVNGQSTVLVSALRQRYRDLFRTEFPGTRFIYLKLSEAASLERVRSAGPRRCGRPSVSGLAGPQPVRDPRIP